MPVHLGSMDRAVETIIRDERRPDRARATSTRSTRPTTAARICPTSPCARRCSTTAGRERPVLRRLARPSRRYRRHHARLDVAARDDHRGGRRLYRQFQAGRSRPLPRSRALCDLLTGAQYPARNPLQNVADLKAQIAANEKGVQELRKMVGAVRARRRARLHGPRAGQRRGERAPRASTACTTATFRLRDRPGHARSRSGSRVDKAKREATVDFTGTSPQQADQLQRARAGDARRRALRLPRHGRRRHPDERRLPAADQHRHPGRLDAVAATIPPRSSPAMSRRRQAVTDTLFGALGAHGRARRAR